MLPGLITSETYPHASHLAQKTDHSMLLNSTKNVDDNECIGIQSMMLEKR